MGRGGEGNNTVCAIFKIVFYSIFGLAIPIACLVFAVKYDGECPAQPLIIIYLYVSAAFCLIRGVLAIIVQVMILCGNCDDGCCLCVSVVFDAILAVFLLAWFIAGSVWVYKEKGKINEDEPTAENYCNPKLYNFSFAILTTQWVLIALSMVISIVGGCCMRK